MMPRKEERNKDLVLKKKAGWSYERLSRHFNIDVRAAWEIFHRDKGLYHIEDTKELSTA